MKAFLAGLIAAVVLAVAAGLVLERFLSQEADSALAAPSARVGPSIEERGWDAASGEG